MTTTPEGGMGGSRHDIRQHLTIIRQAVDGGWDLPPDASAFVPAFLQSVLNDPAASTRDRIRASECLAALRRDRVEAAIQLDKIIRLDAGTATDRVELLNTLTDAQLGAVAKAVKPDPCPASPPKPKSKRKP